MEAPLDLDLGLRLVEEGLLRFEELCDALRIHGDLVHAGVAPLPGLREILDKKGYLRAPNPL